MFKKLIFFISFTTLVLFIVIDLRAAENNILPLKKPVLTILELNKKVSINILKPLAKPNKIKKKPIEIVKKKEIKLKLIIPKKKPLIAGVKKKERNK